jgi:hypothetical protein
MSFSVLHPSFNTEQAAARVIQDGYFYQDHGVTQEAVQGLMQEAAYLPFTLVSHTHNPGMPDAYSEHYSAARYPYNHSLVPTASYVAGVLAEALHTLENPLLDEWSPTHLSYQSYGGPDDCVSPRQLSTLEQGIHWIITVDATGPTRRDRGGGIDFFQDPSDAGKPPDYQKVNLEQSYLMNPGGIMLLGTEHFGGRKIHASRSLPMDVRLVLDVSMQPDHPELA